MLSTNSMTENKFAPICSILLDPISSIRLRADHETLRIDHTSVNGKIAIAFGRQLGLVQHLGKEWASLGHFAGRIHEEREREGKEEK